MALKITRVQVWTAGMKDKPGGLAGKLAALARAGASLEFIFARRAAEQPGGGIVFLAPLKGATQIRAAKAVGFESSKRIHTVRVAGPDKPGLAAKLTQKVAAAGLNLRGLSAMAVNKRGVMYLAVDSAAAAAAAARALKKRGR